MPEVFSLWRAASVTGGSCRAAAPREGDLLLPLAAAICIFLGWYVFLDYEQATMVWAEQAPALLRRIWPCA
jgi:hypothetical protein